MKNIKLIIILFFASFLVFNCNREDEKKEEQIELSGTWKYAKVKLNLNDSWQSWSEDEVIYYKLRADYKFEVGYRYNGQIIFAELGKWELNDTKDTFRLDYNDSSQKDYSLKIIEKNGSELTLHNSEDWYELWIRQ